MEQYELIINEEQRKLIFQALANDSTTLENEEAGALIGMFESLPAVNQPGQINDFTA